MNGNPDNDKKVQQIVEQLYKLGLLSKGHKSSPSLKERLNKIGRFKMLQIRTEPTWFRTLPFRLMSMIILILPFFLLPITYFISVKSGFNLRKIISLDFEVKYFSYYILSGILGIGIPGILHELSHLIVGAGYDCHVVELGLRIRYFMLFFYVRIVGMNRTTKNQKILIYLAGMFYNLSAALISILGICLFDKYKIIKWMFTVHFAANFEMIFSNSLCFLDMDGDRVVQELTGGKSYFLRMKMIKPYERNTLFFLVVSYLILLVFSLNYKILFIPWGAHIFSAAYIILSSRITSKCTLYCLLWQTYGYASIVVYILFDRFSTWRYTVSVGFILILAVNFFMVWLGTLFYFILKATEKISFIKQKNQ